MCWHKWDKWADVRKGACIASPLPSLGGPDKEKLPEPTFTSGDWWIEQEKRCTKCGKVRLRTERA